MVFDPTQFLNCKEQTKKYPADKIFYTIIASITATLSWTHSDKMVKAVGNKAKKGMHW
jgi:hypothetical protein